MVAGAANSAVLSGSGLLSAASMPGGGSSDCLLARDAMSARREPSSLRIQLPEKGKGESSCGSARGGGGTRTSPSGTGLVRPLQGGRGLFLLGLLSWASASSVPVPPALVAGVSG